ncbi:MAG TPA: hypothetical protein VF668_04910 [Pyrinomonadaceae bacterium]|jgi:hypothetical protein
MSQLWALVWLKWRLLRNSLRSRRAAAGRVAGAVGAAVGLLLSLTLALALGAASYVLSAAAAGAPGEPVASRAAYVILFFMFTVAFMTWGLMPVALGGGSRFEPSRMLLYPVSLVKLFVFDFVSDLTGLTSVFVAPALVAVGAGVGLGVGRPAAGLAVGLLAVAFGLSLSKLLSAVVGALMRARRTRGEMLLALLGAALGMTGALMGQLVPLLERHAGWLEWARWTPPGAAAHGLARGLVGGEGVALPASLLTLAAYAGGCALLAYRVARRTALGLGGGRRGKRAARREAAADERARGYAGWRLPFASEQFSALFEKELRYALRNAQLRVIALMAVGLTVVLRMGPAGLGRRAPWGGAMTPYAEGAGAVFSVVYIFMLVSPVSTNLFGYDGSGMRAVVLSPASRRTVLLAKNAALTLVALVLVAVGVFAGGLILGDLTPRTLLFALLAFVTTAALSAPVGNWLSLRFPKRVQFGKRMNRSGVAGLMLVPVFFLLLLPPAASVAAGHFAASHAVKYVILAAFALVSVGLYALALPAQGRSLERRELEVLEAVTGRDGGGDGETLG